jgi:hypothetical protein
MKPNNSSAAAMDMEQARQQLEQWRSTHRPRCRIPATLWARAAELAREHGLGPTARALRLDYTRLKKLVQSASRDPERAELPAFVELVTPPATHIPECVVELEGARGRMRIQMKRMAATELVRLSQGLWGKE